MMPENHLGKGIWRMASARRQVSARPPAPSADNAPREARGVDAAPGPTDVALA